MNLWVVTAHCRLIYSDTVIMGQYLAYDCKLKTRQKAKAELNRLMCELALALHIEWGECALLTYVVS